MLNDGSYITIYQLQVSAHCDAHQAANIDSLARVARRFSFAQGAYRLHIIRLNNKRQSLNQ